MWTNEQLEAINRSGENIIVSAGAGSGKTAVLTERIVKKILSGIDINSLLVLTFTNAAAKEMKERVRKKLSKIDNMKDVLDMLDTANITTFDAYSLKLVKQYHHYLSIGKDISIIDSIYIKEKKKEVINEILSQMYDTKDERLLRFLSIYRSKDDKFLVNYLINLSNKFSLKSDTISYLKGYVVKYFDPIYLKSLADKYEEIITNEVDALISSLNQLLGMFSEQKNHDNLYSLVSELEELSGYDDYYSYFNQINLPRLAKGEDENVKNFKEQVGKEFKNIKDNLLIYTSKDEMISDVNNTKEHVSFIIDILILLENKISEFKTYNNVYEFVDIAKMAINLVKNNENIKEEIKKSLSEILIDEYQDTSDLQEEFINLVANNNLYMVGDIKQSIYRFRNANPYIFKEKYDKYKRNEDGYKIDLNKNFRSRSEVLDNINLIFSEIMTDSYGDASYKKEHQMNFGQQDYNINGHYPNDFNMEVLKYSHLNITDYKKEEIEAFIIAKDILSKIDTYQIYSESSLRKAKYSDFCVIIDRNTHFELFKRVFESLNIPLSINADIDLNGSNVSLVIRSLLKLVNLSFNRCFDRNYYHALMSVGRSFLFEFSDTYLHQIVKNKNLDNPISQKIFDILDSIDVKSNVLVYDKLLESVDFYQKLCLIGNVKESLAQLEVIRNMIKSTSKIGESIFDFEDYLSSVFDSDSVIKYNINQDSIGVKIMNIHKSKGLEFPICYFSMLGVSYNQEDYKSNFGYFNNVGIYIPTSDNELRHTIIKKVGINEAKKQDISEHIRLFYVALTRTREKIIIVSPIVEYGNKYKEISNNECFNHFIDIVTPKILPYIKNIDIEKLNLSKDYLISSKLSSNISNEKIIYKDIVPYKELTKGVISHKMIDLMSTETRKNIDLGIRLHEILEVIDFNSSKLDELSINADEKMIIKNVLANDIFNNIKEADVYHEHEFMFNDGTNDYHGIIDLLLIYEDHIDIIDYKLFDTSLDDYKTQVLVYKKYIESINNKKVNCYLLSLIKNEIKKVDI